MSSYIEGSRALLWARVVSIRFLCTDGNMCLEVDDLLVRRVGMRMCGRLELMLGFSWLFLSYRISICRGQNRLCAWGSTVVRLKLLGL